MTYRQTDRGQGVLFEGKFCSTYTIKTCKVTLVEEIGTTDAHFMASNS